MTDPGEDGANAGRPADDAAPALRAAGSARALRSSELFAGGNEVTIEHGGELYRLRCTSKGKLILTK